MPVNLPNGSSYKLCLLDTNALSEIVKRPEIEGHGFVTRFPPNEYVPCFTVYNVIELRRWPEVFRSVVIFFSEYPCFIAQSHQRILQKEIAANGRANTNDILAMAFSPVSSHMPLGKFLDTLFSNPEIAELEHNWRDLDQETLDTWLARKANFQPKRTVPNASDAKQYVQDATIDSLYQLHPQLVRSAEEANNVAFLYSFPSMQTMLYGQYYRVFDTNRSAEHQDVKDVCISACAPYVDAIVTERFQAEIYRKVQPHIDGMSTEIATLRDLRHES